MIHKDDYYRPRYTGYRTVFALVTILDGVVGLLVSPFGYRSNILADWSAKELRKDLNRAKAERNAKKAK